MVRNLCRALSLLAIVGLAACGSSSSTDAGAQSGLDATSAADAVQAADALPSQDASALDAQIADSSLPDSALPDSAPADSGSADAGPPMAIPDPGTAMDDWGSNVTNACCSTPATAYPVGIVTMNSGYVQGNVDASLDFFYVFKAGPALNQFTFGGDPGLSSVDMHDGTGLIFGSTIPGMIQGTVGTWTVHPNQIYVLHLHATATGFF
jgi:hypothetical protein